MIHPVSNRVPRPATAKTHRDAERCVIASSAHPTGFTFGVWDWAAGSLVPIAKAYSGLTDEEIRRVDAFVRHNMIEKFGPVRTVKPELVFELAFEGLNRSNRHKSGIAVRFPRILRWRTDKTAAEADTLDTIRALLPPEQ